MVVVGAVLLLCAPAPMASEAYWAAITQPPELIVVGELSLVARSSYERPGHGGVFGSDIVHVFDQGFVLIDIVLWGEESVSGVPITWQSNTRLEPPVEDRGTWSSGSREFESGARGIWVIWPKKEDNCRLDNRFHTFQYLTLDRLEKVEADIVKHLVEG